MPIDNPSSASYAMEPLGGFSAKSTYQEISQGSGLLMQNIPPTIEIFSWLPTREQLSSIGQIHNHQSLYDRSCAMCA
jgi:hypothetical protein